MQNQAILFDGDTFTHNGRTFHVSIVGDDDHGAPWIENDGHSPVSAFMSRAKKPGERVLHFNRGFKRFYDFAEATRIAKRDGWGLGDEAREALTLKLGRAPTKGEIIAQVVENDFEHLRRWCADDWHYVGVCVRHESQDDAEKYRYAVWGIESDCEEYITQTAYEMAEECAHALDVEIAANRQALKTNRQHFKALAADLRKSAALTPAICEAMKSKLQSLIADRAQAMARIAELSA